MGGSGVSPEDCRLRVSWPNCVATSSLCKPSRKTGISARLAEEWERHIEVDTGHRLALTGGGGGTVWKKINQRNSLSKTREHNKGK